MNGTEWNGEGEHEPDGMEAALTRALRRVEAPDGFVARVMALAEAERRTSGVRGSAADSGLERTPWWRLRLGWKPVWGALAALLVAGMLTGHAVHERHEAAVEAQASRKFDVSVSITDRALEHAREQLRSRGVPLEGEP